MSGIQLHDLDEEIIGTVSSDCGFITVCDAWDAYIAKNDNTNLSIEEFIEYNPDLGIFEILIDFYQP
jgi:hypothetical protein